MIVLELLLKERALLWSFCLRKTAIAGSCSRRPVGDVALSIGKRLQNSLPEFRRCVT
jgi:hypothetical protein